MEKGISRRGKGSSDRGKGSSHRGRNESGKKTSKQVVKKRHPTLFGLPGFDVSVNKIDKKTKKVITSFVRKDVVVGSEGVALPKFLSSYPCGGCHKEFNTPQGLGGHQIWYEISKQLSTTYNVCYVHYFSLSLCFLLLVHEMERFK